MLKLGWVYNVLHDDREAVKWFNLASKSSDPSISSEAGKAYHNLAPAISAPADYGLDLPVLLHPLARRLRLRPNQNRAEARPPSHSSLSVRTIRRRYARDYRTHDGQAEPQYLSESSFIFGAGVATLPWRGITGWFEAGEAVNYLPSRTDVGTMIPDYRGGISYAKGFGHLLNSSKGLFSETNDDAVFVSRFQDDMIYYSQNRSGYTFASSGRFRRFASRSSIGTPMSPRTGCMNTGLTTVETGPGLRFRFRDLPKSLLFSVNFRARRLHDQPGQSAPSQLLRPSNWNLVCIYALSSLRFCWSGSVVAASVPVVPAAATLHYHIAGDDPGPWPQIFSSIGITRAAGGPGESLCGAQRRRPDRCRNGYSASSKAASWCWKAKGNSPRRSGSHPGQPARGGAQHRGSARAQAARSFGNRRSKFPSSIFPRTRSFWPASAGTMRRLRWRCIAAWAPCCGSPRRPAKKATNGFPTCSRRSTISA